MKLTEVELIEKMIEKRLFAKNCPLLFMFLYIKSSFSSSVLQAFFAGGGHPGMGGHSFPFGGHPGGNQSFSFQFG